MKEKELFLKALNCLFFSWGSDTPQEVIWGGNDLLIWFEKEYQIELGIRFKEDEKTYELNFEQVIEKIKES